MTASAARPGHDYSWLRSMRLDPQRREWEIDPLARRPEHAAEITSNTGGLWTPFGAAGHRGQVGVTTDPHGRRQYTLEVDPPREIARKDPRTIRNVFYGKLGPDNTIPNPAELSDLVEKSYTFPAGQRNLPQLDFEAFNQEAAKLSRLPLAGMTLGHEIQLPGRGVPGLKVISNPQTGKVLSRKVLPALAKHPFLLRAMRGAGLTNQTMLGRLGRGVMRHPYLSGLATLAAGGGATGLAALLGNKPEVTPAAPEQTIPVQPGLARLTAESLTKQSAVKEAGGRAELMLRLLKTFREDLAAGGSRFKQLGQSVPFGKSTPEEMKALADLAGLPHRRAIGTINRMVETEPERYRQLSQVVQAPPTPLTSIPASWMSGLSRKGPDPLLVADRDLADRVAMSGRHGAARQSWSEKDLTKQLPSGVGEERSYHGFGGPSPFIRPRGQVGSPLFVSGDPDTALMHSAGNNGYLLDLHTPALRANLPTGPSFTGHLMQDTRSMTPDRVRAIDPAKGNDLAQYELVSTTPPNLRPFLNAAYKRLPSARFQRVFKGTPVPGGPPLRFEPFTGNTSRVSQVEANKHYAQYLRNPLEPVLPDLMPKQPWWRRLLGAAREHPYWAGGAALTTGGAATAPFAWPGAPPPPEPSAPAQPGPARLADEALTKQSAVKEAGGRADRIFQLLKVFRQDLSSGGGRLLSPRLGNSLHRLRPDEFAHLASLAALPRQQAVPEINRLVTTRPELYERLARTDAHAGIFGEALGLRSLQRPAPAAGTEETWRRLQDAKEAWRDRVSAAGRRDLVSQSYRRPMAAADAGELEQRLISGRHGAARQVVSPDELLRQSPAGAGEQVSYRGFAGVTPFTRIPSQVGEPLFVSGHPEIPLQAYTAAAQSGHGSSTGPNAYFLRLNTPALRSQLPTAATFTHHLGGDTRHLAPAILNTLPANPHAGLSHLPQYELVSTTPSSLRPVTEAAYKALPTGNFQQVFAGTPSAGPPLAYSAPPLARRWWQFRRPDFSHLAGRDIKLHDEAAQKLLTAHYAQFVRG